MNEDSVGLVTEGDSGFFVLADGLGGIGLGEMASQCVVDAMVGEWEALRERCQSRDEDTPGRDWVYGLFEKANKRLLSMQEDLGRKMRSTAVMLRIDRGNAVWAHVGDSRLYYIHDGEVRHVTSDHTVAFKKYRMGHVSYSGISGDEDRNLLLKSLGGESRHEPEYCPESVWLEKGDGFLLCTDGFWEGINPMEILVDHLKSDNARDWARLMLERIVGEAIPCRDNMTLITVMVA